MPPRIPPPELDRAEDFIDALGSGKPKQLTKRAYRTALRRLALFLSLNYAKATIIPLTRLHAETLVNFRAWLGEAAPNAGRGQGEREEPRRGYSDRTIRSTLACAIRFLQWLDIRRALPEGLSAADLVNHLRSASTRERDGYPAIPPTKTVPYVVDHYASQPLPEPPAEDASGRTRSLYLRQQLSLLRNRALTRVLFASGARAHELASLKRTDWDSARNTVIVKGKFKRPRTIPLDEDAAGALGQYLEARDAVFVRPSGRRYQEWLFGRHDFTGNAGKSPLPITTKTVWKVVTDAVAALPRALKSKYRGATPHDFRRYLATELLNEGMPLHQVQALLGHATPETTRVVYAAATPEEGLADSLATYRQSLREVLENEMPPSTQKPPTRR